MTKLAAQPPEGFIPAEDGEAKEYARSWDWATDGEIVQGDYHGSREIDINGKTRTIHDIVTDEEPIALWGTAVLDKKLAGAVAGQEVWIHRLGKVKSQNGTEYWDYEIFVKPVSVTPA